MKMLAFSFVSQYPPEGGHLLPAKTARADQALTKENFALTMNCQSGHFDWRGVYELKTEDRITA